MYDLPNSFDPGVLEGTIFDSVTFAEYVAIFRFGGFVISCQFAYTYGQTRDESFVEHSPIQQSSVMQLVGSSVVGAFVVRQRELHLIFSGGGHLEFMEDQRPYESFIITHGDEEWIV